MSVTSHGVVCHHSSAGCSQEWLRDPTGVWGSMSKLSLAQCIGKPVIPTHGINQRGI